MERHGSASAVPGTIGAGARGQHRQRGRHADLGRANVERRGLGYSGEPTANDVDHQPKNLTAPSPPKESVGGQRASIGIVFALNILTSEWRNRQTRQLEGLVRAISWGFKSPLRHVFVMCRDIDERCVKTS